MMRKYKINTLYEKTSSFSDGEKTAQYAADMYNEKILYGYFKKKNKSNAYMWDALSVR